MTAAKLWRAPGVAPLVVLATGVLAGWAISTAKGGATIPFGLLVGYGVVLGCGAGLSAIGLVLVYRSARIINFSQAAYGTNALVLYLLLAGTAHLSYWLAAPLAVGAAAFTAALVELLVIRRFSSGSRLVLTLVTVVVLQLLDGMGGLLPRAFGFRPGPDGRTALPAAPPPAPFVHDRFNWDGAPLNGAQVEMVAVTLVMVLALTWFLGRSRLGLGVRAAAENAKRTGQLGVNSGILSMTVWVIVAVFSAVGAISAATASGTSLTQAANSNTGVSALLVALAGAVLARLDDIPLAFAGAVALSIFEQGVQWAYANSAVVDVVQFLVILGALLVQRSGSKARTDESFASSWTAGAELRPLPGVMAKLPPVVSATRWVRVLVVVVIGVYPFAVSSGGLDLGTTYAIYAIIGLSLVVLSGWAGQISLGQFGFAAVGALVGGDVIGQDHLPFAVALIAGTLAAAVAAVLVGLPALRVRGLYLAVTTLSLAVALASMLGSDSFLANHLPSSVGRPDVLGLNMNSDPRAYFYLVIVSVAAVLYLTKRLRGTRFGRLLIAIRDNEPMAAAYGQRVVRARLAAFALAGGMAGFAGVLFVCQQRSMIPAAYNADTSVQMFLMAVLGGLGSPYAVLSGAVYFVIADTIFSGPIAALLSSGLGVLVIMLFLPGGLGAAAYRVRDSWLRRQAQRYGMLVPSLGGDRVKRGEEALVPIASIESPEPVAVRYRLPSRIGEQGASQVLEKIWRY